MAPHDPNPSLTTVSSPWSGSRLLPHPASAQRRRCAASTRAHAASTSSLSQHRLYLQTRPRRLHLQLGAVLPPPRHGTAPRPPSLGATSALLSLPLPPSSCPRKAHPATPPSPCLGRDRHGGSGHGGCRRCTAPTVEFEREKEREMSW